MHGATIGLLRVEFVHNMQFKYREKEWTSVSIGSFLPKELQHLSTTFNVLPGYLQVQPECSSVALAFAAEDFLTSNTAKIFGFDKAQRGLYHLTILSQNAANCFLMRYQG